MPRPSDQADALLNALRPLVGPGDAGPSTFDRLVRAILDHKDDALNQALRDAGLNDLNTLAQASPCAIADAAAEAGRRLAPREAKSVQRLAAWLVEHHEGDLTHVADHATETLRGELLAIGGIGATTVDRVLLVGLGRPVMPVERGAYRIAARHGWLDVTADQAEARSTLESLAGDEARTCHAGLREVARKYCKPARPHCERCPLQPLLGPEGPIPLDDGT